MLLKRRLSLLWCCLISLTCSSSYAASKPLLVFYRPWFVAKPYSEVWGWHWTMDHFNPEQLDASGQPHIASWYHPLIGPYDSRDPAALEYHVLLMKLSGIDGLVVNWFGPDDYLDYAVNNERAQAIFNCARKAGLKFALCYEDQSIRRQVVEGHVSATNAVARAQLAMLYAQTNFFNDPAYVRLNDRPVLLNFGPQFFKDDAQWKAIFSVLEAANSPAFFTEDFRLGLGQGAFSWPPMWLSLAGGTRGVLSMAALQEYLSSFEDRAKAWPSFISTAFPRFHDIYHSAGVGDSWGYLGDGHGYTFRQTLSRALKGNSAMTMIVTWNDFAEGTVIEPTIEYGFRDLGIVQEQRRLYLDASFPYHTNDLALALRFYDLRRQFNASTEVTAELDRVFTLLTIDKLADAGVALKRLELRLPKKAQR